MTTATDWTGRVGRTWAAEWQRTERSFADLSPHLDAAIRTTAPAGRFAAIDIGCGVGTTGAALAAARPDARVVGVDLSADLIAVARDRPADRANLTFRHGDALDGATVLAPVDFLVSRHGVMFFADPVAAFTTLHRATRPGGTLVFSCFADRAATPGASDFVAEVTGAMPDTPSGYTPGPFGFADPDLTAAILTSAGWRDASPTRVDFAYRVGMGDDPVADAVAFFRRIGPLAAALRDAPDPTAAEARLKIALERYRTDRIVALPASAWIWRARATGESQ